MSSEIRWKIDAYTAETMPLDRLAEYLKELAALLGEPQHLHLMRVDSSSTVPVLRVDDEAVQHIRQRGDDIRFGRAPSAVMQRYRKINQMLRDDKAGAALYEGDAEIIPFPGLNEPPPTIGGVRQQGALDGRLQRVGGVQKWVPIQLRTLDDQTITHCYALRSLAKEMGHHLFEPVRLYGRGRWTRTARGEWVLDDFYVDTFEVLSDEPLPSIVAALRSVRAEWSSDPIGNIQSRRDDE